MKLKPTKSEFTSPLRITQYLSGNKFQKVLELKDELMIQGKSHDRALADALETLKLPTVVRTKPDAEETVH